MIKVKVIKRFKDKETGIIREIGTMFECSATRLKEIQSAGNFVEIVKSKAKKH